MMVKQLDKNIFFNTIVEKTFSLSAFDNGLKSLDAVAVVAVFFVVAALVVVADVKALFFFR